MPEIPRYMIHSGSYIEGLGVLAREGPEEHELPYPQVNPRNSWTPLNGAAEEAFKRRNAKILARQQARIDEVKKNIADAEEKGAIKEELAGLTEQLRLLSFEMVGLPLKLKAIPRVGPPAEYTYSDSTAIGAANSPAHLDETIERIVDAARAGGANESDIKTLRASLSHSPDPKAIGGANEATAAAAKTSVDVPKPKIPEKPVQKRASDS